MDRYEVMSGSIRDISATVNRYPVSSVIRVMVPVRPTIAIGFIHLGRMVYFVHNAELKSYSICN